MMKCSRNIDIVYEIIHGVSILKPSNGFTQVIPLPNDT